MNDPFENIPARHRFGGLTERDPVAVRWMLVGLVVFWIGLVLAVRACA